MSRRDIVLALALLLAIGSALGFIAAYVTKAGTQLEGIALALSFGALSGAVVGWEAWILPHQTVVDERSEYPSPQVDRIMEAFQFVSGERAVTSRKGLVRLAIGAFCALGLALIVPLRSLGPAPDMILFRTKWRRGSRLVGLDRKFVRATDLKAGSATTVFPENGFGDAYSVVMLIRFGPGVTGIDGMADGYIAYSKVCTHAGCPVALYRAATQELLCPCHQSVFDVADGGRVLSGPADRPLPQLPLEVDPAGYLRAARGFSVPVGPGFWEMRNG
jgi:ubiquinol-cytochrome c reductase iron-sulfur subunit